MKQDIKELWVQRLESGHVPQAREMLADEAGGRCCLGVLCDIAIEQGIEGLKFEHDVYWVQDDDEDYYGKDENGKVWRDWDEGNLPPVVTAWAGLDEADPVIDPTGGGGGDSPLADDGTAITCNDTRHMNFAGIAALIRKNL